MVIIWPVWKLWKAPLSLVELTQDSLYVNSPNHKVVVKKNQEKLFNIVTAEAVLKIETNKKLTKKI